MQLRLRDHLANAFNDMKKTTQNVFDSPRALAKLLKEAGRVKNVLSANVDHYAQIEGLLDEQDFKYLMTREALEKLNADLFERVDGPVQKALDAAGLTMDVINSFVLFGGATRTPKIQEILKKKIGIDLAKNLNADEAAVMGAVYRAADLATGFKVKKFIIKDAVLHPIHVVFERESGNKKSVTRTLFGPMNTYPQKKVITFNKHKTDFDFTVNYADLDYLGAEEIANIGSLNISKYQLTSVTKLFEEKVNENVESKGIKAHFALDDSGIFALVNAELLLEKTVEKEAEEDKEGAFSKLGSTISKLFGGDTKEDAKEPTGDATESTNETEGEEKPKPDSEESTPPPPPTENQNDTTSEEKPKNETSTEPEKPKVVTVKEPIDSTSDFFFAKTLEDEQYNESLKRIQEFAKFEREKLRRENAVNSLETHVIEVQERFDQKEYASCATDSEKEEILKMASEISEWIYEDGLEADVEVFEQKLEKLKKKTNEVYARHWEHEERPEALKALNGMITGAEGFLATARNVSKDPEKSGVFSEKEVEDLAKGIQEVMDWRDKEVAAQEKLARNEPVKLTVQKMTDKMAFLDREVKYLVNKIKAWRPKEKPKEKKKKKEKNETVIDAEEPTENVPTQEEEPPALTDPEDTKQEEEAKVEEQINPSTTTESKEKIDGDHTEL
jgi:hypoxia up-regulated 1